MSHHFIIKTLGFLPNVIFNSDRWHIEFFIRKTNRRVAKQGQSLRIIICQETRHIQSRVCRRNEGCHRIPSVTFPNLARAHILPQRNAVRQVVQTPARRQFYPIFGRHGVGKPTAATNRVERFVFKHVAFCVGVEEVWRLF